VTSASKVRTHQRRTAQGNTATVHQHARRGAGSRARMLTPRHAWKLARSAGQAARRKRRVTACVLGGLAVGELGAWVTLRGVGLILATAGVLALAVATAAWSASGSSRSLL
jgi:hypothetical protein